MYQHLFGPVPSRRLGMSLGVDLVPHKVCSLNCIYCECGKTTELTIDRKEYVPTDEVLEELGHFFDHHPDPDTITFSGAGEPTLHVDMLKVLRYIKGKRPGVNVAVLTNGTLLSDSGVRKELLEADIVLPSLDAATDISYRKINRPLKGSSVLEFIDGLIQFRKEFSGVFWLEVFILPGYNDDVENITALKNAIEEIQPERIQLNTLDRPGLIDGLRSATHEELKAIVDVWGIDNVEIILPASERKQEISYRDDMENAILETISRRPCTLQDIQQILGVHINELNKYLGVLEEAGKIETTRQDRGVFYQIRK